MVYMEPDSLGVEVLYKSWKEKLYPNICKRKKLLEKTDKLHLHYIEEGLFFLRK